MSLHKNHVTVLSSMYHPGRQLTLMGQYELRPVSGQAYPICILSSSLFIFITRLVFSSCIGDLVIPFPIYEHTMEDIDIC